MCRHTSLYLCLLGMASAKNMNGLYEAVNAQGEFVPFNSDYASKGHEYFEVYTEEIATHYSEVFWTACKPVSLPENIIERFKGKVMAVTGYEMDQVMKTPIGDVSVPINWAYNHHYVSWMTGAHSEMQHVAADPNDVMNHGAPMTWKAVDLPSAKTRQTNAPTKQFFSEGNGGESRHSFHGYPNGYAQLIDSPDQWTITPMQIDTRNRDCGANYTDIGKCTKFTPGPEPKSTRYFRGIPKDTNYSGVLECPCTSRFGGDYGNKTKIINHQYVTVTSGTCEASQLLGSASSCFDASLALNLGRSASNQTITDNSKPRGCFAVAHPNGTFDTFYNAIGKSLTSSVCGGGSASKFAGTVTSDIGTSMRIELDPSTAGGQVTITIAGPADGWIGFGFNATIMHDMPYTIVVNSTGVMERKIGDQGDALGHEPGTLLAASVTTVSNTVQGNIRTVVLTRPIVGKTADHFTFGNGFNTIPVIAAYGQSQTLAYHKARTIATVSLAALEVPTCICDQGVSGQMCKDGGVTCTKFTKDCKPEPIADLLEQRNPTCNSRTYVGGLHCCAHKNILLDVDQPVRPELLRYHLKWRFWFQEYTAAPVPSHEDLTRLFYQTELNSGEYDVPPAFAPAEGYPNWPAGKPTPGTNCTGNCPDGPDCECLHTITARWSVTNMELIYASHHCHAPMCHSAELWNEDTNELLCRQIPVVGQGNVSFNKYDEAGYIKIPPCLFGPASEGLQPSKFYAKANLLSIKKCVNTHTGHYGEMAMWQMRSIDHPANYSVGPGLIV